MADVEKLYREIELSRGLLMEKYSRGGCRYPDLSTALGRHQGLPEYLWIDPQILRTIPHILETTKVKETSLGETPKG